MSRLAALLGALGFAATIAVAPAATADPDVDTQSAAAVIEELQAEGYAVEVNGSPAGDTSLLSTCTVTSIGKPGIPTPDPTTTTTISVAVACPITHG